MKRTGFRRFLYFLYVAGFGVSGFFLWHGWSYYSLPLLERPYSHDHLTLKPGGLWGHGLGIVGSGMILLLFLYSVRKRGWFGLRWGRISRWLDIHIFLGIMGPILVTLHTSMKFNGIVSISYFSMLAVMFSGVLGRYIYMQIPRDDAGDALTLQEIESKDQLLGRLLRVEYNVSPAVLQRLQRLSGVSSTTETNALVAIVTMFKDDIVRPFRLWSLRKDLRATGGDVPRELLGDMMRLARQKILLVRRRAFLDSVSALFHYWHVIHKPFAYVMVIVMFVHIIITVTFGYRWIF